LETQIFKISEKKIILRVNNKICDTPEELLRSKLFKVFLKKAINFLYSNNSSLLNIFPQGDIKSFNIDLLIKVFLYLLKIEGSDVSKILTESKTFFKDTERFNDFVEFLYNYWRSFDRFIICTSEIYEMDKKPYRVFNVTIENLTHLVRQIYRDIQENITGKHPSIYRQVIAGAEIATITSNRYKVNLPETARKLLSVPVIRQILLNPPLILNPPMNKRSGIFTKINVNPLESISINPNEWVMYPAKVGNLLIFIYFHDKFLELGLSLCNLFELAENEDLSLKPDGIFVYGVPGNKLDSLSEFPTVFYDDIDNEMLIGAIPNRDEFGYFGYLKKMTLTLHNIRLIKNGILPFHGALVKINLKDNKEITVLIVGDSGAGKSETLEAFRMLGQEFIREMIIISDDMGSIQLDKNGRPIGYGTEIGAFVRLDDLQPGYAFGQIDRTIIMNPSQTNARAILPVTTYSNIVQGYPIDIILYANNYEEVNEKCPIIEQFSNKDDALRVFREGAVMSKGTTTSTGLIHNYFANIFGPPQYKKLHEQIADHYFRHFFENNIFVGQIRTRLGLSGWETKGPIEAAKALLQLI